LNKVETMLNEMGLAAFHLRPAQILSLIYNELQMLRSLVYILIIPTQVTSY
jgi:hypothetical protein